MKRFQISEGDLAVLEHAVPQLHQCAALSPTYGTAEVTVAIEQIQRILSDVRWEYAPYTCITRHDSSS